MATINFTSAVGRVSFNGGMGENGKIIRKSKTYRNIKQDIDANNLHKALAELANLSSLSTISLEKIETSLVNN